TGAAHLDVDVPAGAERAAVDREVAGAGAVEDPQPVDAVRVVEHVVERQRGTGAYERDGLDAGDVLVAGQVDVDGTVELERVVAGPAVDRVAGELAREDEEPALAVPPGPAVRHVAAVGVV